MFSKNVLFRVYAICKNMQSLLLWCYATNVFSEMHILAVNANLNWPTQKLSKNIKFVIFNYRFRERGGCSAYPGFITPAGIGLTKSTTTCNMLNHVQELRRRWWGWRRGECREQWGWWGRYGRTGFLLFPCDPSSRKFISSF